MLKLYELNNGTKVAYKKMPYAKSISCYGYFPFGVAIEPRGYEGITHLIEHMIFSGTTNHPTAQQISQQFEKNGVNFEAITFRDMVAVGIQSPADLLTFRNGFILLMEALFSSMVSKEKFLIEKKVIEEEINYYSSEPDFNIWGEVSNTIWGHNHPLGKRIEGRICAIKNITFDEAVNFYKQNFNPENLVLCIAGNIEEKYLKSILEFFEETYTLKEKSKKLKLEKSLEDIDKKQTMNMEMVWVGMGFPFKTVTLDRILVELAEIYLIEGESAVLSSILREEEGLLYNLMSNSNTSRLGGEFALAFTTNEKKVDLIKSKLLDSLLSIRDISEELFEISKKRYISNLIFSCESSKEHARLIGRNILVHGNYDCLDTMVKKITNLEKKKFEIFFKETFTKDSIYSAMIR